jgi:demethylmenaquinone methyltransferase/2-methoxy-6-polyprenyl-1,4-benzoquinol methylase
MSTNRDPDGIERLLDEQVSYYRARAPEYLQCALDDMDLGTDEASLAEKQIVAALDALNVHGHVLELACGPGTWTARLAARAESLTAVDASPEMLALAAERVGDPAVRFEQADLFRWRPARRYDVVFFGFWLSHVPLERFDAFWATVADALAPDGLVIFLDDGFRSEREPIHGPTASTIQRWLSDGTRYRAVKVAHEPAELEQRLARLGWAVEVRALAGPFFIGAGRRAG